MSYPIRPGATKPMSQVDIAWAAGLIEGEGSFSCSRRNRPFIQIQMCDKDVLEQIQQRTGMGNVTGPYAGSQGLGVGPRKPTYSWKVYKQRDVWRLLLAIAPLLSERRRARIMELANG